MSQAPIVFASCITLLPQCKVRILTSKHTTACAQKHKALRDSTGKSKKKNKKRKLSRVFSKRVLHLACKQQGLFNHALTPAELSCALLERERRWSQQLRAHRLKPPAAVTAHSLLSQHSLLNSTPLPIVLCDLVCDYWCETPCDTLPWSSPAVALDVFHRLAASVTWTNQPRAVVESLDGQVTQTGFLLKLCLSVPCLTRFEPRDACQWPHPGPTGWNPMPLLKTYALNLQGYIYPPKPEFFHSKWLMPPQVPDTWSLQQRAAYRAFLDQKLQQTDGNINVTIIFWVPVTLSIASVGLWSLKAMLSSTGQMIMLMNQFPDLSTHDT